MKKSILLSLVLGLCSLNIISQTSSCVDDGFENLATGPIVSSAWIASSLNYYSATGCNIPPAVYTQTNSLATVMITPITNTAVNNVSASPLGGNKVVYLQGNYTSRSRLSKTFTVDASNFVYRYAYKASIGGGPGNCESGMITFKFYDCSNVLISALSQVIQPRNASLNNTDADYWKESPGGGYSGIYTPEWIMHEANLSPYIGSCIKVEVDVSSCTCGGYTASCYFDAICSTQFLTGTSVNPNSNNSHQNLITSNSYTSCTNTATLAGLTGFSSYLWQGPAGSSVSGSTLSAVTTTLPGSYTLTASAGTLNVTQQVNLTVSNLQSIAISGGNFVCAGNSMNLQIAGAGINSYSWSTGATTASVTVTPTASMVYTASVTHTLGCVYNASLTVNFIPLPVANIVMSNSVICAGQNDTLHVPSVPSYSYAWSNGATLPAILVSPPAGVHVYTVSTTNLSGCSTVNSATLTVNALPQLQLVASASAICVGQLLNLTAQSADAVYYTWNTGSTSTSIAVSPTISAVYSYTAVGYDNCTASISKTITVNPLPQPQITGPTVICSGQPANLTVQGTNIAYYTWNTGATAASVSNTPTLNSAYSVTVTSADGCAAYASQMVTVNPLPQMQAVASATLICAGEPVQISANSTAVLTYSWSSGFVTSAMLDYPTDTYTYVVTGTDANGCVSSVSTVIQVSKCTGIEKTVLNSNAGLIIFPNPSTDVFTIKGYKAENGQIINSIGQLVREFNLTAENGFTLDVSGLAKGIYFVLNGASATKLIVK
jgi:hypothetical protein